MPSFKYFVGVSNPNLGYSCPRLELKNDMQVSPGEISSIVLIAIIRTEGYVTEQNGNALAKYSR